MASTQVAGRYRLVEQLGSGGMGRVWLARDEMLHRDVAVKEVALPEGLTDSEREELRLLTLREARAAAQLSHPNVIGIYDVLHTQERPWIVMEYVRGRSLVQVVHQDGPMPPQRVAQIGLAVLAALRAAHSAGVLHRDVKPGNVLLAEDGRVVLTDFGLAVFTSGEGMVTNPGLVRGSPQYISPERARDGVSSPESDLWSLGATLYTAVEGRSPYARDTPIATLTALATGPPDAAPRAGALRPVLDGLLRRNPASRMKPEAVERALRRAASEPPRRRVPRPRRPALAERAPPPPPATTQPLTPPPAAVTRHRIWRRRTPRVVAGLALVVLAVPGAVLLQQARAADPGAPAALPAPEGTPAGVPACPPLTGPAPASRHAHEYTLVPGWVWYDDPSGFSVAVPAGWSYAREASLVCFGEDPGGRVLAVEQLAQAGADLVGHWARTEAELVAAGRLPGYQQVAIRARDYHLAAADWELRYGEEPARRHAIARGFRVTGGQTYAIHWSTPEFDWQVNRDYFDLVVASFTPAGA